jgi:hypothetical protein
MFPVPGPAPALQATAGQHRLRERSLAARDERSESPVAGTQEGRTLTTAGRPRTDRICRSAGPVPGVTVDSPHIGWVDGHEGIEYTACNQDGDWQVRVTQFGEPYPAHQWAHDQQALGGRVFRRRVVLVDGWAEMRLPENA